MTATQEWPALAVYVGVHVLAAAGDGPLVERPAFERMTVLEELAHVRVAVLIEQVGEVPDVGRRPATVRLTGLGKVLADLVGGGSLEGVVALTGAGAKEPLGRQHALQRLLGPFLVLGGYDHRVAGAHLIRPERRQHGVCDRALDAVAVQ